MPSTPVRRIVLPTIAALTPPDQIPPSDVPSWMRGFSMSEMTLSSATLPRAAFGRPCAVWARSTPKPRKSAMRVRTTLVSLEASEPRSKTPGVRAPAADDVRVLHRDAAVHAPRLDAVHASCPRCAGAQAHVVRAVGDRDPVLRACRRRPRGRRPACRSPDVDQRPGVGIAGRHEDGAAPAPSRRVPVPSTTSDDVAPGPEVTVTSPRRRAASASPRPCPAWRSAPASAGRPHPDPLAAAPPAEAIDRRGSRRCVPRATRSASRSSEYGAVVSVPSGRRSSMNVTATILAGVRAAATSPAQAPRPGVGDLRPRHRRPPSAAGRAAPPAASPRPRLARRRSSGRTSTPAATTSRGEVRGQDRRPAVMTGSATSAPAARRPAPAGVLTGRRPPR